MKMTLYIVSVALLTIISFTYFFKFKSALNDSFNQKLTFLLTMASEENLSILMTSHNNRAPLIGISSVFAEKMLLEVESGDISFNKEEANAISEKLSKLIRRIKKISTERKSSTVMDSTKINDKLLHLRLKILKVSK